MNIQPKQSSWRPSFYEKISNLPEKNSLTLPNSREEVINYLKWWNLTTMHNACTVDIFNYEQLLYYEMTYSADKEIQNLITILKEKIVKLYEMKSKWLDNLIDKDIYKTDQHEWTQKAADSKMYSFLDKGEIGWDSEF